MLPPARRQAGAAILHDLERPARVGRRHDRLLREERLVWHEAEVLVDRRVVDGEAARVEVGQLVVRDAAREDGTAVEPVTARELLQPVAVGSLTGDHRAKRRLDGERLEQQVDALGPVEAPDREDEVAVLVAAVRELLRWAAEALRRAARSSAPAAPRRSPRSRTAYAPRPARPGRGDGPRGACARPSGDWSNWPSSVPSSSYACRN